MDQVGQTGFIATCTDCGAAGTLTLGLGKEIALNDGYCLFCVNGFLEYVAEESEANNAQEVKELKTPSLLGDDMQLLGLSFKDERES